MIDSLSKISRFFAAILKRKSVRKKRPEKSRRKKRDGSDVVDVGPGPFAGEEYLFRKIQEKCCFFTSNYRVAWRGLCEAVGGTRVVNTQVVGEDIQGQVVTTKRRTAQQQETVRDAGGVGFARSEMAANRTRSVCGGEARVERSRVLNSSGRARTADWSIPSRKQGQMGEDAMILKTRPPHYRRASEAKRRAVPPTKFNTARIQHRISNLKVTRKEGCFLYGKETFTQRRVVQTRDL